MNRYLKYCIIGLVVLLIPIVINILLLQPMMFSFVGSDIEWLSFWGNYVGSIISCSVALFILWCQERENQKMNMANRQLQVAVFKHGQKQMNIDAIRKALVDFQVSFNYLEVNRICGNMIANDYKIEDYKQLEFLVRDIDEKNFILETLLYNVEESEYINHFNFTFNQLYNLYGLIISDLCFFFDLMSGLPEAKNDIIKYVEQHLESSSFIDSQQLKKDTIPGLIMPKSIEEIIVEFGDFQNIRKNAPEILKQRLKQTLVDGDFKEELKVDIINLLHYEQNKIDKELTEKVTN